MGKCRTVRKDRGEEIVPAFYMVVDGKTRFGPYLSKNTERLWKFLRLKGITTEPVTVKRKDLRKAKKKPRREKQPGLFDSVTWIPVPKMDAEGWGQKEPTQGGGLCCTK